MSLFEQAATFLEAEGWQVSRLAKGQASMVASRETYGGDNEYLTVWCPSPTDMKSLRQWESATLRRFSGDKGTPGRKVLLLDSQVGITSDFREQTKALEVKLQVPIQFFDATFCWDDTAPASRRAASAANHIRQEGVKQSRERAPQPFHGSDGSSGPDLLEELARRFESRTEWDKPIILVTAPAGFGKSMLFRSLFARAHDSFHVAKQRQEPARRPLPLLPEYVSRANSTKLPGLVEQFLRTDVARSMTLATFEWMLTHGYACWMLDGLDELVSRDPYFFEYIEDIILAADKVITPRILICVRDSLISTSESLRGLVNDVDTWITRFDLDPWGLSSVEYYAKMRLGRDHHRMTTLVQKKPDILKLCGTPYYSKLVADRLEHNAIDFAVESIRETDLVGQALDAMIVREYEKNLIDPAQFSKEDMLTVVHDAAEMQLSNTGRGIATKELADEVSFLLEDLDEPQRQLAVAQTLTLSVFTRTDELNRLRFTHDVVFDFLIGRRAGKLLETNPQRLLTLLNWQEFAAGSIALRILRDKVEALRAGERLPALLEMALAAGQTHAFRNLVTVIAAMREAQALLRQSPLAHSDLSRLAFCDLSLAGVSMRDANLEAATFDRCDLTGLDLAGAVLHDTRFDRCRQTMFAATYGNLSGFVSVVIDGKQTIDKPETFAGFLHSTGNLEPCAAALQLRKLFLKFLFPDGRVRRPSQERNQLLKGISLTPLLDAALKAGYITRAQGRERYVCAKGPLCQEMVDFHRKLQASKGILALLDGVCPERDCVHIGRS